MELFGEQSHYLDISTGITPVSYFIQRCRKKAFETDMITYGIQIMDISFQDFSMLVNCSFADSGLSEYRATTIIKDWVVSLSKAIAVIPLFEEFSGHSFVTQREKIEVRSSHRCTIYCSTDFNIYYYVGYFDDYTSFTAILHSLNDAEVDNFPNIADNDVHSVNPFQLRNVHDSRSVVEPPAADNRSSFSAPVFSSDVKDLSFVLPQLTAKVDIPDFSLVNDVYTPKRSLVYGGTLSPVYSDVLQKGRDTICIFSNAELSDYVVITMSRQLCDLLSYEVDMAVSGFFFNSCGWYLRYHGDQPSVDVVKQVYQTCVKSVSFSRHIRIQLSLSDKEYISLLIYVAEVSNGTCFLHRTNDREIIMNGNDPYFYPLLTKLENLRSEADINPSELNESHELILTKHDDTLYPLTEVTGGEMQCVWKDDVSPRKLPSLPEGFSCFLSRCKRQSLIMFIAGTINIEDPSVIRWIINCKDGYFVIFPKVSAPSPARWKKIKQRITPELFYIQYKYVAVQFVNRAQDLLELRSEIEESSEQNATLYCSGYSNFIVGSDFHVNNIVDSLLQRRIITTD